MKFKMSAGAEFDVLTKKELDESLRDWMVEAVKGARPIRFSATATIAANAFTVDTNVPGVKGVLGPGAGFMWSVKRLAIVGPTLATDPSAVFINGTSNLDLVYPALTGVTGATGFARFGSNELMLGPEDHLVIASTGSVAATGQVIVSGAAIEFPSGLLWKML